MRRVKDQDEEGKGPGDQEDPGIRGPRDQRRTRGPEDQRTRGPEDQGTKGSGEPEIVFSRKLRFSFQYHPFAHPRWHLQATFLNSQMQRRRSVRGHLAGTVSTLNI